MSIEIRLKDMFLNPVGLGSLGIFDMRRPVFVSTGLTHVRLEMLTNRMADGEYVVSVDLTNPFIVDRVEDCVRFQIDFGSDKALTRNLEQSWGYGSFVVPLAMALPSDS